MLSLSKGAKTTVVWANERIMKKFNEAPENYDIFSDEFRKDVLHGFNTKPERAIYAFNLCSEWASNHELESFMIYWNELLPLIKEGTKNGDWSE